MAGEVSGYKPGVVEKIKFEYAPLGKVSNEGLKKDDKKKENIKGKNREQLKMIENKEKNQLGINAILNAYDKQLA